ncbi:hypothetical protein BpHYR1_032617 [Brachionus plicatilis]|uniref:Uncharacterized protein n=1 Tax=Brachionus plicatilis TaxID=10195 RepID=A0A3M7R8Y8_BRAPC|nr:hypothetical protein BpHYR1_032617 [Brachionus plicatilis]
MKINYRIIEFRRGEQKIYEFMSLFPDLYEQKTTIMAIYNYDDLWRHCRQLSSLGKFLSFEIDLDRGQLIFDQIKNTAE